MKPFDIRHFVLLAGIAISSGVVADDMLPKELKGNISRPAGNYNVSWSISVESQDANGDVKGKFNFQGRSCRLDGLAFTGTNREGSLRLTIPAASANCGPWDIKLTRTGQTGFEFNGLSTESTNPPANAYLKGD